MDGDEIRRTFLEFFQSKGHAIMPSSSLVPAGDPTLLFTSAGMVPLKPYFMGESTPPARRLTSCQKSFRTSDVDEVGDHKHLTFFEMLGNFSIGDYFKPQAINWAWEFVTGRFGLPAERLYVTIYLDDEEAFRLWTQGIGVPEERVYRYGDKDNWWGPAGKEGPCGPCSEIHYDRGVEHGCGRPDCHPNHDCQRFVELWNLVFMQFYQDANGARTPLPAPSIDTGLGLERAAGILQGKSNVYETDLFWPIVQTVCRLSGREYGRDRDTDYAIRVVAEHGRAVAFLIADGVAPGNESRGYVLRRIIRRAIRYGRRLGLGGPFLGEVAEAAIQRFQAAYPELSTARDFILRVVALEEERFSQAINTGMPLLDRAIIPIHKYLERNADCQRHMNLMSMDEFSTIMGDLSASLQGDSEPLIQRVGILLTNLLKSPDLRSDPEKARRFARTVSGPEIFLLYDTYGFPPEITAEIAREHGLEMDMEGFHREMDAQRQRARASHAFTGAMEMLVTYEDLGVGGVAFVGYDRLSMRSVVAAILAGGAPAGHATQGQPVELVLRETAFYAEGGGQAGDSGAITGPNGRVLVEDTQSPVAGLIVHRGVVEQGDISLGDPVEAIVDQARRLDTARNHSGAHILHAALRQVLGGHVRQAGSLVAADRLRFDYSHVSALSREDLMEIQGLANQRIRDDLMVSTRESTYAQAVQEGALAFFGDRYGDVVRLVEMSNGERFSLEVCGGTHVKATGQVGSLFILGESSIGGGMRRIEAVTGRAAERLFMDRSSLLESLARKLQAPVGDLETRLESLLQDADSLGKQLAVQERQKLRIEAQDLLANKRDAGGVTVVSGRTSAGSVEAMREMGDWLRQQITSGVVALGAVQGNRPIIITMVTPDLVAKGLDAGAIVRDSTALLEGGGGGRKDIAQGGGKRADRLDEALGQVKPIVERHMTIEFTEFKGIAIKETNP